MRRSKIVITIVLLLVTGLVPLQAVAADTNFYTYTYDLYEVQIESPDAYTPEAMLLGSSLGIGDFKNPKGLFATGESIYIVDTGNHRIVEVTRDFQLVRVIDHILIDGETSTFKNPQDIFVSEEKEIYICDTENNRVLHTDSDLNLIKTITKPQDETFQEQQDFIPLKCVVDRADRVYILAANVNKGFMEFDLDGEFNGYLGANKVKVSFWRVLQKRFMTKAQRSRMELFVPTEYSNLAIDEDNFIYATTTTYDEGDLVNGLAAPIRKINSLGEDILIRNGYEDPIGELWWGTGGDIKGPSKFEDITALNNDTYYALDRVRGRIFGYDFQGNLLYAFGGIGNRIGYFLYPVAIDHIGTDLLVLDNRSASVTRFRLTEYGSLINNGLMEYKEGRYDASADYWRQVLHINGNYYLAYTGIGRALLRQDRFKEAMRYFKAQKDFTNYSKAFAEYRKEWVEEHIELLIGGAALLILLPKLMKGIRKIRKGEVFRS